MTRQDELVQVKLEQEVQLYYVNINIVQTHATVLSANLFPLSLKWYLLTLGVHAQGGLW